MDMVKLLLLRLRLRKIKNKIKLSGEYDKIKYVLFQSTSTVIHGLIL